MAQATETEYCPECDMRQTPKPYHMPKCSVGRGKKDTLRPGVLLEGVTVGKIMDYLKIRGPSTAKSLTDAVGEVAWALGRLKDGGHLTSPVRGVWMLPGDERPIPEGNKSKGRWKKKPAESVYPEFDVERAETLPDAIDADILIAAGARPAPEPVAPEKPPLIEIDWNALKLPAVELDLPHDPSVKLEYVPPPPLGNLEYRIALLERFPGFDATWDVERSRLWYNSFFDCFIGWASYLVEDDDAEEPPTTDGEGK